ncbi:hypothetical protein [Roseiflexus sp.]|uniref:hypothetical protein n=1 Tax=Roseiflexus sp. TaxID=2562120 RepID=UPI00258E6367|nr:hypothetical protein [Roseiflexus sp.]
MRRQAVIRTKPDRALCARRTFPFIAARMLTRRPYRVHAPKRWARLAQAAAHDPDSAALVLARAHDRVWRTLPHAVIADLARSAARTPETATAALKGAPELVWRALSADDIGAVIQSVVGSRRRGDCGVVSRVAIRAGGADARRAACAGAPRGERPPSAPRACCVMRRCLCGRRLTPNPSA